MDAVPQTFLITDDLGEVVLLRQGHVLPLDVASLGDHDRPFSRIIL